MSESALVPSYLTFPSCQHGLAAHGKILAHKALMGACKAIAEDEDACNCVEVHSWYGDGHATACPCAIAQHALDQVKVIGLPIIVEVT
jgi:hypothetical protein